MQTNAQSPRWSQVVALVALLGVVATAAGCAEMMVGRVTAPGVAVYNMGDLGTVESAPMDRTWAAAQAAVKKLELTEFKTMKDALEARLEAHSSTGRTVVILLRRINDSSTEVHIRIGTFGEEAYSRQVLEAIHGALNNSR